MKKLAIFLAIMLIPFSAFALDTISDNDLDSVTGQAGVSIFTNSIQIVKTGVTTTYTDSNGAGSDWGDEAGSLTIVSDRTVSQIFFKGYDPINIDIVDMDDAISVIEAAAGAGVVTTFYPVGEFGDSGVQITLPNAIVINNILSSKTYYASDATAANLADTKNEMINIATNGGTTTISLALVDQANGALADNAAIDAYLGYCNALAWNNMGDDSAKTYGGAGVINHADQIKILITSHE